MRSEFSVLEPSYQLYEKHLFALANGVALLKLHCPFKVVASNFPVHDKVPEEIKLSELFYLTLGGQQTS